MLKLLRAKLHGIYVTDANLNYHGSITLDPIYCEMATIYPLEFVEIWNKHNGMRFSTYVIYGEPGSKACILNGSAARLCQKGDQIIVAAYHFGPPDDLLTHQPKILTFNQDNSLKEELAYSVLKQDDKWYEFAILGNKTK
jgi:aspartate 1-decarboxylase